MPLPAEGLWAVLEIMGHRRIAGRVTEETIAGAVMPLQLGDGADDEGDIAFR